MTDVPRDPLVPAEVDLKDYSYMPLEFRRLFRSDTWVLGTPEQKVACLHLWCESWHQRPAGSLPSNDVHLADLSKTGARWKRLREHCLRGWLLCSDGRYYHPVVSEKAMDAWEGRLKASQKGRSGAAKRWHGHNPGNGSGMPELWPEDGKGKETKENEGKGVDNPPTPFALPDWVDPEAWAGFVEMRAKSKHPLNTDRARKGILADLVALRAQGQDPNLCLDQSTKRGWRGVFEVKGDSLARTHGTSLEERNRAAAANFAKRGGEA